jgi:glycosyltransferase involved in cell wall biosynthesis
MINIISNQANAKSISGPMKVFENLKKGLDKIGYPYVINRDLRATSRIWIHDNTAALRFVDDKRARAVIGPNLYVMPSDIPENVIPSNALYVHPSEWAADLWKEEGFSSCSLSYWPVGIDTDDFAPSGQPVRERKVLVYHKERDPQGLVDILGALHERKLEYRLIIYGQYSEAEYREALSGTSFVIWHGRHESQGIALQEALACDVPMLVCDVASLLEAHCCPYQFPERLRAFPVTAAPYFDGRCGMVTREPDRFPEALDLFLQELGSYSPREYILDRLSLEKCALDFVSLWEHWGLSREEGCREQVRGNRGFEVPLRYRVKRRLLG